MNDRNVLEALAGVGAVLVGGHFVDDYFSHHSSHVNMMAMYPHPEITRQMCGALAERFASMPVDVVVGLGKLGHLMAHEIASHLNGPGEQSRVKCAFAEKDAATSVVIFSEFSFIAMTEFKRAIIVSDSVSRAQGGQSITDLKMLMNTVRNAGGLLTGVGVIANHGSVMRSELKETPELISLVFTPCDDWRSGCPLCEKGIPIDTRFGRGKEYVERDPRRALKTVSA